MWVRPVNNNIWLLRKILSLTAGCCAPLLRGERNNVTTKRVLHTRRWFGVSSVRFALEGRRAAVDRVVLVVSP